jgi:hemolysin activation/secretion protein
MNSSLPERSYKIFFLFTTTFLFIPFTAIAQNLPPAEQPGAQGSRFRAESEQEKKRLEEKKIQAPRIEIEQEKAEPAAGEGPSFLLKKVNITGVTIFKPEDFRSVYQAYIGKSITFKDLEDIAAAIKAVYKKKGCLSSGAYIPEQDIKQGEVEIRVIEGKLGEVRIEGNRWFKGELLKKYVHLKKNELLDIFKLQRDMLRLNQNPDLEVFAVVSPGKGPASTDIVLKVKDSIPYHAGINFDNQGTRLVGKYRDSLVLRSTNLMGLFDSFSFNALITADSSGEFVSYAVPLDTYGTKAGLDLTFFKMRLGREYRDLNITGSTSIITPHVSRELSLSEDFQAYADAGIDIKVIKKKSAGELVTNDQLRLPYALIDLAKTDTFLGGGQTVFSPRISASLEHLLGASSRGHPSASRPGTGGAFFKYEQTVKRIQKFFFSSFITARSQFQAASRTLPSSEQIQLGGLNSVRGYPEGEYLADMGGTLNVEWAFPRAIKQLQRYLYPVVFTDMAAGLLKSTGSKENRHRFLMGAGLGLRFQFKSNLSLRLDWARHLGDRPTKGQGPSTFYLTAQCEI